VDEGAGAAEAYRRVLRSFSVAPLPRQADASFGLRSILPSEARLRDARPQEDTSHDPRAP